MLPSTGTKSPAFRVLATAVWITALSGCRPSESIAPLSAEHIELTVLHEGQRIHLADDGNAYREIDDGQRWEVYAAVFNPEEVSKAYVQEDNRVYRVAPDSDRKYPTVRSFSESFENLTPGQGGLRELVDERRALWGSFTLQSPQAPRVDDYVRLRKKLLEGQSSFGDCRVEVTTEKAHTGTQSLKCIAPAKSSGMITSKASLSSPLPYFRNGDEFSYEAWYWVDENLPLTLADLESEFIKEHAGIRLRIYDDGSLGAELKALDKPQFRQQEPRQSFPKNQWVHVRFELILSDSAELGRIAIWQDDQLVLSCNGQTLPFRSAIYNSLEVGVSAYSQTQGRCVLYVDDIRLTDKQRLKPLP